MKLKLITLISIIASTLVLSSAQASNAQQRRFQSGSRNYIGVGATTSGVAAYSKLAINENFSLRPFILFDDLDDDFNGTAIIPVTYDFYLSNSNATPFVGVGGGSQTRNFDVGLEFTTGVDYELSRRFTATGLFNIQLFDNNDISAIFGMGLNL